MYTLLLYVHVLALVYWLGGDLGKFLCRSFAVRRPITHACAGLDPVAHQWFG